VGEPEGDVGEEIAGGGVECADGALGDGVGSEAVGEGNLANFLGDLGDALGELVGELAEVAEDGREAGGEEECEDAGYADDQKDDGCCARGMVAAEIEFCDAGDGGHEDDSEEGADVEHEELFLEGPGKGEEEQDRDAEEDVAADFIAGSLLVGGEVFGCGAGQLGSPWILGPDTGFEC
jgi:hypothetical protein